MKKFLNLESLKMENANLPDTPLWKYLDSIKDKIQDEVNLQGCYFFGIDDFPVEEKDKIILDSWVIKNRVTAIVYNDWLHAGDGFVFGGFIFVTEEWEKLFKPDSV